MPYAPPSRCTDPECRELATKRGRCDDHQPEPWVGRASKAERYGMSSGSFRALKAKVSRRDRGCCYMCGDPPEDGKEHELEHKVPVAEGGARADMDNLGLACRPCHAEKSAREAQRGAQRARARRSGRPRRF